MPAAFDLADFSIPVARLRTRTDACGTTAPLASATCPRRAPVATEFWAVIDMQPVKTSQALQTARRLALGGALTPDRRTDFRLRRINSAPKSRPLRLNIIPLQS